MKVYIVISLWMNMWNSSCVGGPVYEEKIEKVFADAESANNYRQLVDRKGTLINSQRKSSLDNEYVSAEVKVFDVV